MNKKKNIPNHNLMQHSQMNYNSLRIINYILITLNVWDTIVLRFDVLLKKLINIHN